MGLPQFLITALPAELFHFLEWPGFSWAQNHPELLILSLTPSTLSLFCCATAILHPKWVFNPKMAHSRGNITDVRGENVPALKTTPKKPNNQKTPPKNSTNICQPQNSKRTQIVLITRGLRLYNGVIFLTFAWICTLTKTPKKTN